MKQTIHSESLQDAIAFDGENVQITKHIKVRYESPSEGWEVTVRYKAVKMWFKNKDKKVVQTLNG